MSKLISTFKIGFDDETKAEIAALKGKLDIVSHRLNVGHAMPTGGLLAVMAGEVANDSNSVVDRETINDVDYLSTSLDESVPHIDDVLAHPNWLSESAPQITQADMQLIFIKNLSDVLIQRMHSMDRFSEDDYAIGGDKLMPWDILVYEPLGSFNILIADSRHSNTADFLVLWDTGAKVDSGWFTGSEAFKTLRTITEAELPAFRVALEACYV